MKLPAFFGHKRSINLLPRDSFEKGKLGIILEWSLVFGKWAVILTQLIVMGAFLYRFTLDRSLTDLSKAIAKDVAIIKSYEQVERDFILTQKQVKQAKIAMSTQDSILKTLNDVMRITNSQIWYDQINLTPSTLSLNAYAASLPAFGQYLMAVQTDPMFKNVQIGKLESSTTEGAQMQFDITLTLADQIVRQGVNK